MGAPSTGRSSASSPRRARQGDAPRVTFYVETPCIEESLARAGELGGKTLMPRTELPGVILGMFADPEGNVVGLVEAQAAA